MRFPSRVLPRAFMVAVTSAALLAVPGLDSGASGQPAAEVVRGAVAPVKAAAATRANTSIRFLDFDHTRGWRRYVYVKGQVTATKGGQHGAVKSVRVRLYRKLDGQSTYRYLATQSTGSRPYPRFEIRTRALGNAVYKVVFPGNSGYQPTSGTTRVLTYRSMRANLEDGTGSFHGFVKPKYNHHVVYLEKRACAHCPYRKVRSTHSGSHGHFQFTVPAPRTGRWWWRASTPATSRFIWSYTGVFTTRLS